MGAAEKLSNNSEDFESIDIDPDLDSDIDDPDETWKNFYRIEIPIPETELLPTPPKIIAGEPGYITGAEADRGFGQTPETSRIKVWGPYKPPRYDIKQSL